MFYIEYLDQTFEGLGTALASQNKHDFEDKIKEIEDDEHIVLARLVALQLIRIEGDPRYEA